MEYQEIELAAARGTPLPDHPDQKLSGYGRNRCDLQIGDRRTVKWLIGYANFYIVFSA